MYRLCPNSIISKFWQKIIHLLIQFTALIFATIGLAAVIKYHKDFGYKNFIDVHSWCGLATFGLFTLQVNCVKYYYIIKNIRRIFIHFQLIADFVSFVFPRLPDGSRAQIATWHAISGKIIVLLAILTAINGAARIYRYVY